jgi:hypothetical protein
MRRAIRRLRRIAPLNKLRVPVLKGKQPENHSAPLPVASDNEMEKSTAPGVTAKAVTYEAVRDPKPEAIVVYCSDPRFQTAFDQFIQKELGLPKGQFMPLVVGGGAGVLSHPLQLPKEFKFLKERFEVYRDVFPSLRRIVLINHEDCRYYDFLKTKVLGALGLRLATSRQHAREDLSLVSLAFKQLLAHLGFTVEFYFAKFADAERSKIVFERVNA